MKRKYSDIIKYCVSALLALVLLYFSFRGVDWNEFIGILKECRWGYVILSMAAGVAAFWVRGRRWRGLLLPIDPATRTRTLFNAVNIGNLANFVLPRIGEFVRCGVVSDNSREGKATYDKVLGTVALERSWDLVSMALILITLLVFKWEMFGSFITESIWKPMTGRLNAWAWVIAAACVIAIAGGITAIWFFRDKSKFCRKVADICRGLVQGFASCLKMDKKWSFFIYTIVLWSLFWVMSFSISRAIPQMSWLGAVDTLFLMVVGSLGWAIPVPGGFGAFHYIVALALSTIYGVSFETGIVFATLSHEAQAVTMILVGCWSYIDNLLQRKKL